MWFFWVSYSASRFLILVSMSASPFWAFFTFYLLSKASLSFLPNSTLIFLMAFLYYSRIKWAFVRTNLCSSYFPVNFPNFSYIFSFWTSAFSIFSLVSALTFLKLFIISIFCLRVVIWISTSIYFFFIWASYNDYVVTVCGYNLLSSCLRLYNQIITFSFHDISQFLSFLLLRNHLEQFLCDFGVLQSMLFFFLPLLSRYL